MKAMPVILLFFLFDTGILKAEWTDAKINSITEHLHDYRSSWTIKDTQKMLSDASGHSMSFQTVVADDGNEIHVTISAETVLVEGKDISGN